MALCQKYTHTMCANSDGSGVAVQMCADSPESLLFAYVISTLSHALAHEKRVRNSSATSISK